MIAGGAAGGGGKAKEDYQVGRDLVEEETAETERVKFSVYVYYAKNVGFSLTLGGVLFYFLYQVHKSARFTCYQRTPQYNSAGFHRGREPLAGRLVW